MNIKCTDLGLKNRDMLRIIYRNIVKNGCNIVNNLRGRLLAQTKREQANCAGKTAIQARERTLTPAENKAVYRELICKK